MFNKTTSSWKHTVGDLFVSKPYGHCPMPLVIVYADQNIYIDHLKTIKTNYSKI